MSALGRSAHLPEGELRCRIRPHRAGATSSRLTRAKSSQHENYSYPGNYNPNTGKITPGKPERAPKSSPDPIAPSPASPPARPEPASPAPKEPREEPFLVILVLGALVLGALVLGVIGLKRWRARASWEPLGVYAHAGVRWSVRRRHMRGHSQRVTSPDELLEVRSPPLCGTCETTLVEKPYYRWGIIRRGFIWRCRRCGTASQSEENFQTAAGHVETLVRETLRFHPWWPRLDAG